MFKDFQLPAAPLFVYLYYLMYMFIEKNYILVKYIGVAVNSGLFLFVYLILQRYYSGKIASLATILASFLYITSPVYAAHDYHVLVDLLVAASVYMLLVSATSSDKKLQFVESFVAGIIVSALFFTKQNVGIFVIFGQLISLVFYKKLKNIIFGYIFGILSFAILFSYLIDYPLINIINKLVFQSDSKGSAFKVLFRFLIEWNIAKVFSQALLLAYLFNFLIKNIDSIKKNNLIDKILKNLTEILEFLKNNSIILFSASLALFYLLSSAFNSNIILVCGISYIFYNIIFNLNRDNDNYSIIFITMLCLLYTNTQTGGIANWGTIIASALFFAVIFVKVINHYSVIPIYSVVLISTFSIAYNKLISPYEFWGSVQTSVLDKQFQLPYKQLQEIYVGKDTYNLFSKIKKAIDGNSKNSKDVYLYPNIPIFYYLHNKLPPTNVIGQWFDFINKEQVDGELAYLKKSPPNLIILFDPPKAVYDGHQGMIGHDLAQREIITLLNSYVSDNRYKIIDETLYCGDSVRLKEYEKKQKNLKVQFLVRNALPPDYSIKNLLELFPEIEIDSFSSRKTGIQSNQVNLNDKLNIGDQLTLNLDAANVNSILNILGDYNKSAKNIGLDSCFNLKILKNNE